MDSIGRNYFKPTTLGLLEAMVVAAGDALATASA